MTEHSDTPAQAGLHDLLNDAAGDFFPGTAPYNAIVGDARRRIRLRAVGGSALSLVAIGAAVAVGAGYFGGAAGHASAQTVAPAAGGAVAPPAVAAPAPAVTTTTKAASVNNDHYGKAVVAQGDFDGTHWVLTRDLHLQENATIPSPDGSSTKGSWALDDVYVTGPNGLRDRAAGGGGINPGRLDFLLNHFGSPGADVAAGAGVTTLGTGSMDNSWNKEKASPYGIDFASGIVSSKVARVHVVFDNGTSQDAKLVAAPAGEDGQYFYLPFKSTSWHPGVHFVFYDGQGHVLPSMDS